MSLLHWTNRQKRILPEWTRASRFISQDEAPALVYAIGDIHGCYDAFCRLEDDILADINARGQGALIVVLGDFIDRGPESSRVIDRLLSKPPEGVTRLCLSGNHEATMVAFLEKPHFNHVWLKFGGLETLRSYGIDPENWATARPNAKMIGYQLDAFIPAEHMRFVAERPFLARFGDMIFVHAGIDMSKRLDHQDQQDLLWMRQPSGAERDEGRRSSGKTPSDAGVSATALVIHGHTPVKEVDVLRQRINLDTGAFAGGALSAARLVNGRLDGLLASK